MNRICVLAISIIMMYCFSVIMHQTLIELPPTDEGVSQIKWISLSYNGYEKEKEAIINYYQRAFEIIRIVKDKSPDEVPIAVGYYDFNHDGVDEIITFISDTEFHGAKDSGGLYVLKYDGKVINGENSIAGFQLDTLTLNDPRSKQIGVIYNEEGWDDLYINGLKWKTAIDS